MADELKSISVIEPISSALRRVKKMLFSPFDIGKWFVIGFCAWLAGLGSGGGSPGFNFNRADAEPVKTAKDFILSNLPFVIFVGSAVAILVIAIWLVITWLSSRGKFMFLHCVTQNKAQVKVPWAKYQQHGNSLFLFRIILAAISIVIILLPVAAGIIVLLISRASGCLRPFSVFSLILIGIIFFLIIVVFALIQKFTVDFVVPIMSLQTTSCLDGWKKFLALLLANKANFTLYILFQIAIGMVIGAIIFTTVIASCCCACCFLAIPYISTVVLLPILSFKRAYSLYYLAQFGLELDCFVTKAQAV